jgi:hypothetical protein
MAVPKGTGASITAAACLAAITVFVFYTLRDYGPRSALRRFHDDVRSQNAADLQQVTAEPINTQEVQRLAAVVYQIDQHRGSSRVAAVDRDPGEVELLVLYSFGRGTARLVWIVDHQSNGTWAVDATKTLRASAALQYQTF